MACILQIPVIMFILARRWLLAYQSHKPHNPGAFLHREKKESLKGKKSEKVNEQFGIWKTLNRNKEEINKNIYMVDYYAG